MLSIVRTTGDRSGRIGRRLEWSHHITSLLLLAQGREACCVPLAMWQLRINTASTGPVARMFAFLLHHSLVCLPCVTLVSHCFYFESRTDCADDKFLPFGGHRSPGSASESKLTCMDYGTIYCIGKQVEHNFSQITNL